MSNDDDAGLPVHGFAEPEYDEARVRFTEVIARQSGTGAAFAVWREGRYVIDLWGGWADAGRTRHFQEDSLVQPYSVTKPFAAITVPILVDRGMVSLEDDVRTYWPDLQTAMTVRQALCHQSGLVYLDEPAPTAAFFDWDQLSGLLARQTPAWPPGTAHGESALFYGHTLGQVVRAVDGRSLGTFLRDEVCQPLGLDFHVGLPDDQHSRVVELTGFPKLTDGAPDGLPLERAMSNPPGALASAVVNSPEWRRAEIPAVNGRPHRLSVTSGRGHVAHRCRSRSGPRPRERLGTWLLRR